MASSGFEVEVNSCGVQGEFAVVRSAFEVVHSGSKCFRSRGGFGRFHGGRVVFKVFTVVRSGSWRVGSGSKLVRGGVFTGSR